MFAFLSQKMDIFHVSEKIYTHETLDYFNASFQLVDRVDKSKI